MRRLLFVLMLAVFMLSSLAGCYVYTNVPPPPPAVIIIPGDTPPPPPPSGAVGPAR